MKRFASFVIAGLLAGLGMLSGMIAEPAAQEVPRDVPQTAGQPEGEPIPISEEPTLLYATGLMQRAEVYARSIAEMSDLAGVEVLHLSELPRADASPAIFIDTVNRFTAYYSDDIAELRSAMADNPVVAEALQNAGVELSDVVAAEIRPDLALRVYVPD